MGQHVRLVNAPHLPVILLDDARTIDINLLLGDPVVSLDGVDWLYPCVRRQDCHDIIALLTQGKDVIG